LFDGAGYALSKLIRPLSGQSAPACLILAQCLDSVGETVRHYDHFINASRRLSRFWRVSHLLLEVHLLLRGDGVEGVECTGVQTAVAPRKKKGTATASTGWYTEETILSALASNVGVAVLIVTPDKTTASPTKPRYSPSSTAKNIASASLCCGGKFGN
jgi:hypothetical protein